MTKEPLPEFGALFGKGVTRLETVGEKETVLEVDNTLLPMNDFMGLLAGLGEIQDISIKEMGIDKVIRAIYRT